VDAGSEFWQKEAHRYEAASRAMALRTRTEMTLGVTALGTLTTIVVANGAFELLLAIPLLALAVWCLALSSVQESFLLDAHLMYAETRLARALELEGRPAFPTWADNGGNLIRFGLTQRLMTVSWVVATLLVVGSSTYFLAIKTNWVLLVISGLACVTFVVVGTIAARSTEKAGSELFERFRGILRENGAEPNGRKHRTTDQRRFGVWLRLLRR
jgi:hypothetical protein